MTRRSKRILMAAALVILVLVGVAGVYAGRFKSRLEEEARRQVIQYLGMRFDSDVALLSLRLQLPPVSSVRLLVTRGRGAIASVEGSDLVLRHHAFPFAPPLLKISRFRFDLDLGMLGGARKTISRVEADGMELNIPPKEDRAALRAGGQDPKASGTPDVADDSYVVISELVMTNSALVLRPKDPQKPPLRFDIERLYMQDAGPRTAMKYQATLTNAKPIGLINATGGFGPWNADDPGSTSLDGNYEFHNADLGIFKAIGGILESTGKFSGTLSSIDVAGEARVPKFMLKSAGNPVDLRTTFQALVDGTNGNTTLRPVHARLGNTEFVTSGAIIKHEEFGKRSIRLTAKMKGGKLHDVLRLAMKGTPFMEGKLNLDTVISIPPLSGKVREKLELDGTFSVERGVFQRDAVQDKVDELSRRGQGQPQNLEIDDVISALRGKFGMEDEVIHFTNLRFNVPGADVALNGSYDLDQANLDFHGDLRLKAKVSQTLTGWKRWLAKPVDPFFAKDGAGTVLKISVLGPASHPIFGKDHGHEHDSDAVAQSHK